MKPNTDIRNNANVAHPELSFAWDKNPSVQKLLDAVVHILANEYVRAVKENPILFGGKNGTTDEIASAASRPRNDGRESK